MRHLKYFENMNWIEDWEEEEDLYNFIVIEHHNKINIREYWLILHSKSDNKFYTIYTINDDRGWLTTYEKIYIDKDKDIYVMVNDIGGGVKISCSIIKEGSNVKKICNPMHGHMSRVYTIDYIKKTLGNITYDSTPLWNYIKKNK